MVAAACGFNQALVADGGDSPGAAVFYLHPPSPQILGAEVTAETRSPMAISLPPGVGSAGNEMPSLQDAARRRN